VSDVPSPALLRGLTVPAGGTPAERRAAAILADLGAEPQGSSPPVRDVGASVGAAAGEPDLPGLPAGAAERALALATAAAVVDGALSGREVEVSVAGVLAQL
jgi:hypothetical protein